MKVTVNLLKYEVGYVNSKREIKTEYFYKQGRKLRSMQEAQRRFMQHGQMIIACKLIGRFEYNIDIEKEEIK